MNIRLSDFTKILDSLGLGGDRQHSVNKLAMRIFNAAVPYNVKDRVIVGGDATTRSKLAKVISAAKTAEMTVQRFNRLLDAQRRAAGHRHITPIRQNSANYTTLKEIAFMACEFSNTVGIQNIDEGCRVYIQFGLDKMKHSNTYALGKFKYYDSAIYSLYESMESIQDDPKPKLTKECYNYYVTMLAEYAGIERDLTTPEDYVCFVYTRLEADRVQADYEDWIRAQFEEMGRAYNVIPNPKQLFSEAALRRYYSYFRTPKKEQEELINMDYAKSKDDFEERYQAKLREKYSEK